MSIEVITRSKKNALKKRFSFITLFESLPMAPGQIRIEERAPQSLERPPPYKGSIHPKSLLEAG